MDQRKRKALKRAANHKNGISQLKFAARFGHILIFVELIFVELLEDSKSCVGSE